MNDVGVGQVARASGYAWPTQHAYADRQGERIPLDSLARKFRSYNDLLAYLQAGSFIGYVQETYGLSPVRALWDQGFEQLETILGKTPAAIDTEWRSHLKSLYPRPQIKWVALKKSGCQ